MPIKKRVSKMREHRITDEAVELWNRGNAIIESGDDAVFEEDGGRRNEYLEVLHGLSRALGLKLWHDDPFDVPSEGEPEEWMMQFPDRVADFKFVQGLRRALERASKRAHGPDL